MFSYKDIEFEYIFILMLEKVFCDYALNLFLPVVQDLIKSSFTFVAFLL